MPDSDDVYVFHRSHLGYLIAVLVLVADLVLTITGAMPGGTTMSAFIAALALVKLL